MCHGPDGTAQTAIGRRNHAKDLTDRQWQEAFSDSQIQQVIREGVAHTKMRGFGPKMTAQQLEELVRIIRSFRRQLPSQSL